MKHVKSVLIIGIILVSAVWYRTHIIPRASVLWDEAVYLQNMYWTHSAMRTGNLGQIWSIIRFQFEYPPFQSIIQALPMLPFQFSIETARTIGLLYFFGISVLLWHAIKKTHHGPFAYQIGILGLILFITSPLVGYHASVSYKEMLGALCTFLCIHMYGNWTVNHKRTSLIITSISMLVATMTKYHYGVFITSVIIMNTFLSVFKEQNKISFIIHTFLSFIPSIFFMLYWIVWPVNRIGEFIKTLSNATPYMIDMVKPLEGFLYYPLSIVYSYSLSPIIGIGIIIMFILSLSNISNNIIRVHFLLVLLTLLFLGTHFNNMQSRYLMTVFPSLLFVSIVTFGKCINRLCRLNKKYLNNIICSIVLCILLIPVLLSLPTFKQKIIASSAHSVHSLTFNQIDYQSFHDAWLSWDTSIWPDEMPDNTSESPDDVVQFIASHVEKDKKIHVVNMSGEFSKPYYELMRDITPDSSRSFDWNYREYTVITEIFPSSRYFTLDYKKFNLWRVQWIGDAKQAPNLRKLIERDFDDLGVRVSIYGVL